MNVTGIYHRPARCVNAFQARKGWGWWGESQRKFQRMRFGMNEILHPVWLADNRLLEVGRPRRRRRDTAPPGFLR